MHQCARPASDSVEEVMMGGIAPMIVPDTSVLEQVGERHDTVEVIKMGEVMGDVAIDEEPPVDTARVAVRRDEPDSMVYNGGISLTEAPEDAADSVPIRKTLTRWSRGVFDTVKRIVADSLVVVRGIPGK